MNNQFLINILLLLSIVLQSFVAIGSPTENHTIDIEHLKTTHHHSDDLTINNITDDAEQHDISDCHHCGHCSGTHLSLILVKYITNHTKLTSALAIPHQSTFPEDILETSFRPPIS